MRWQGPISRSARSLAVVLSALVASATISGPVASAGISRSGERITGAGADTAWDLGSLRELDDSSGLRDPNGLTVSEMKGMAVVDVGGRTIGKIDDVLADPSDRIVAVTVEIGGFIGIGTKEVVLGIDRLELRRDQFATAMTRAQLGNLPEWRR